jgi:chromosome segregation ATPase
VRDEMLAPSAIASVRRSLNAALTRKDREGSRDAAQKRLREVQREIANIAEAIANIGYSDALRERLQASEAEQKRLQRELAPVAAAKPTVDDLMGGYRKMLMELSEALKGDTERARPLLRQALGEVKILQEGEAIYAEIAPTEQRLLLAAGGDASKSGCGDMQRDLEAGIRYRIK